MQYGLGHLSVVPIREAADPNSLMVSQLLYGDLFKIKEERKLVSKIQLVFDGFEGWVKNDQIRKITEEEFQSLKSSKNLQINAEFLSYVTNRNSELILRFFGITDGCYRGS